VNKDEYKDYCYRCGGLRRTRDARRLRGQQPRNDSHRRCADDWSPAFDLSRRRLVAQRLESGGGGRDRRNEGGASVGPNCLSDMCASPVKSLSTESSTKISSYN